MRNLTELTQAELESRIVRLGRIRKTTLVALVLCLAEVHRRRLHLASGFDTLAEYCREALKEDRRKAWRLGLAAEAVADFPLAGRLLSAGLLTVSALIAVKRALNRENHEEVLNAAIGMSEEEAESLASEYCPRMRRRDSVRVVHTFEPKETGRGVELELTERCELRALVSKEVQQQLEDVRFALSHQVPDGNLNDILALCFRTTLAAWTRRKVGAGVPCDASVEGAQDAVRPSPSVEPLRVSSEAPPSVPNLLAGASLVTVDSEVGNVPSLGALRECEFGSKGPELSSSDCAASTAHELEHGPGRCTFGGDCAETTLLAGSRRMLEVESIQAVGPGWADDAAFNDASGDRSRHIPVEVRRAVWLRDRGCCSFVGETGRRCGSRYQIEFDHWKVFCLGGAHTVANVRLLCSRHNRFEAERILGAGLMRKFFDHGGR